MTRVVPKAFQPLWDMAAQLREADPGHAAFFMEWLAATGDRCAAWPSVSAEQSAFMLCPRGSRWRFSEGARPGEEVFITHVGARWMFCLQGEVTALRWNGDAELRVGQIRFMDRRGHPRYPPFPEEDTGVRYRSDLLPEPRRARWADISERGIRLVDLSDPLLRGEPVLLTLAGMEVEGTTSYADAAQAGVSVLATPSWTAFVADHANRIRDLLRTLADAARPPVHQSFLRNLESLWRR